MLLLTQRFGKVFVDLRRYMLIRGGASSVVRTLMVTWSFPQVLRSDDSLLLTFWSLVTS